MNRIHSGSSSLPVSVRLPVLGTMQRDAVIGWLDRAVEASLLGLLIVLPIAHVTAVRSTLIISAGIFWIARMAVSRDWRVKTPVDIPILLYSGTVVVSLFFAINQAEALRELKGELLTYLLIFYVAAYTFRTERQVERFALVLCGWIVLFGLIGMGRLYLDGGLVDIRGARLTSLARGVTNYSDYMILTLPLAAWVAFKSRGARAALGVLAVVTVLLTLPLTHSRAGWIAAGVELVLIIYLLQRQRMIAGFVLVALIGIGGLLPQDVLYHGGKGGFRYDTSQMAEQSGTESIRLYQWTSGVKEMLNHPFQGFGYGRKNYVAGMQAAGPGTLDVSSCNAFLDAWLQLGIQGMIALLAIFYLIASNLRRYSRRIVIDEKWCAFFASGVVVVLGFFVVNQVEGSYVDEMARTFWLLMGLYVGYGRRLSDAIKEGQ